MTITSPTMDEITRATLVEVVDAASAQYTNVVSAIARNPLPAVGIAAGAGFVLARLLRGNRSSSRAR